MQLIDRLGGEHLRGPGSGDDHSGPRASAGRVAITWAHESKRIERNSAMTTQPETAATPEPDPAVEEKIQRLQELFADAPEIAKVGLENAIQSMTTEAQSAPAESAGRVGRRQGVVSELTVIAPFADGGAKRLRGLLDLLNGNFEGAEKVGTVHDMRFVFLDDDTKLLFATAYDGDWDPYIDDFATKIPDLMDILFSCFEGWPGIRSPDVKDFIVRHQVPASAWYVANPGLTVAETRRLQKRGKALDDFLDKISD
jgi:hypothetical protein